MVSSPVCVGAHSVLNNGIDIFIDWAGANTDCNMHFCCSFRLDISILPYQFCRTTNNLSMAKALLRIPK